MSEIIDKYMNLARTLSEQGKTGFECSFCGGVGTHENNHGLFCDGCGAERKPLLAKCFGVPVYDRGDAVLLMFEFGRTTF